jgi:hypothetical protein
MRLVDRIAELMKRKNRKRFAKEAEFARNEARGDFSHLKDRTGAFTATPLPQPTLPQLGLGDDELYSSYAGSEKQSMRGGRPGIAQYPPSSVSGSRYAPDRSGNGGGGGGWDRGPSGPPAALYRTAYPYALSDPDSLSKGGYNESVTSLDNFAGRGAPMGYYDDGQSIQRTTTPGGISRAPSYYSEDEKLGSGSHEDYIVDGRSGAVSPPSQLSYARQSYHQPHPQPDRQPSPYAPHRSSHNPSEVSLTRMRESHTYSSEDIVGSYGWEEGDGREEYDRRESRGTGGDQRGVDPSRMPHYR